MAVSTLPHSLNGTKSPVTLRILPALGQQIDQLHELRSLICQSEEAERRLTAEVLSGLQAAGLTRLAGQQAVAVVDHRTTVKPDPDLFLQATGAASSPSTGCCSTWPARCSRRRTCSSSRWSRWSADRYAHDVLTRFAPKEGDAPAPAADPGSSVIALRPRPSA